MGLESGDYINDLNPDNPAASDYKSQGDDHLRLIKKVLKQTFPNLTGPVTATQDELNGGGGSGGSSVNTQEFTASGTWAKPSGATMVMVEAWGGGGGGASGVVAGFGSGGGGGGGGAYLSRTMKASDLPGTVAVTVGAGGAGGASVTSGDYGNAGANGGSSAFGTYMVAYGGAGGVQPYNGDENTKGGGGGGVGSAGSGATGGQPLTNADNPVVQSYGGGRGGGFGADQNGEASIHGGGGGGGRYYATSPGYGGSSVYGGGAGGSGACVTTAGGRFGAAGGGVTGGLAGGGAAGDFDAADGADGSLPRMGGGGGHFAKDLDSFSVLSMEYGDGKFVATSQVDLFCFALVATSASGPWTPHYVQPLLLQIIRGNGVWVGWDANNDIYSTNDLTDPAWTYKGNPGWDMRNIAYSGGLYVVVGVKIATSTDLVTWADKVAEGYAYNQAAYDGSQWIALGDAGLRAVSADGATWTDSTVVGTYRLKFATNGSVIVVLKNGSPYAERSTDGGLTWSPVSTTLAASSQRSIAWISSLSLFVAAIGSSIYTSSDGATWTLQTDGTTSNYLGIATDGTDIALGVWTANSTAALTSSDGSSWTARAASAFAGVSTGGAGGDGATPAGGGGGGGAAVTGRTSGPGGAGGAGKVVVTSW